MVVRRRSCNVRKLFIFHLIAALIWLFTARTILNDNDHNDIFPIITIKTFTTNKKNSNKLQEKDAQRISTNKVKQTDDEWMVVLPEENDLLESSDEKDIPEQPRQEDIRDAPKKTAVEEIIKKSFSSRKEENLQDEIIKKSVISQKEENLQEEKDNNLEPWKPTGPWDAPPEGFYAEDQTGSMQNCTESFGPQSNPTVSERWDSGKVVVSCHTIHFRAPPRKFEEAGPLIIGVLSAASGTGPERRRYIRQTWANGFPGAFFLVAGPWSEIEKEYTLYQDMIWIDEEEVYAGENSVLSYKTISFFMIAHLLAKKAENGGFKHAVKTDDDSYVNVEELKSLLLGPEGENRYYWGHCPQYKVGPLRDPKLKWAVTYTTYPEPMFPLYCQGAGFGLSRKLLDCAVDQNHVSDFRYIPFEDVSIGILVERCGQVPIMTKGVKVFRADTKEERERVKLNIKASDTSWLPPAKMKGKLIQHRVDTEEDMINHHKSLGLVPVDVKPITKDITDNSQ